MRIISGYLKGRIINGYDIDGTRPTMNRVKESIFGMIQNSLEGSVFLDLFCGSGNIGIEAISNGSKFVYFVDNNKEVIKILEKNLINLGITDKSNIRNTDYKKALSYFKDQNIKFDLIYLDPPYKMEVLNDILNSINSLLNKNGQVICEYTLDELENEYSGLKIIKEKKYGYKYVKIYVKI